MVTVPDTRLAELSRISGSKDTVRLLRWEGGSRLTTGAKSGGKLPHK